MKIIVEKKKGDRCTRIAKRKYDVWPSAYASGAVVKCRQGKIWKGISEELTEEELQEIIAEELAEEIKNLEEKKKNKPDFKKEKEQGLRGWFSRAGGKDGKGWVDCNTCRKDKETGKKTCKTCGRQEGEERAKYPACRPKPSDCGSSGKGSEWGKKSESLETNKYNLLEVEDSQTDSDLQNQAKKAHELTIAAQKDLQSQKSVASAVGSQDPKLKQIQRKEQEAKQLALNFAKENERKAKEAASKEQTVKEEKSNFQKEMERKGKSWKVRLLTKGKQSPGSAYPNPAPMERSKSAPPGAGGS